MSLELKNRELLREQAYINGQWVEPIGKGTSEVINPANGEISARVPYGNAEDVDAAGNNLVQSVGPSNIPTNRYPGGSQTQFGVQSFGVVPAKASNNAELRQGLVQERRMAQATYTNPKLAPVEDYMFAYQAPIPGYTPYYSGNFI